VNLLSTRSFKLATYALGDESSGRLALVMPGRLDTKDYPHMRSHVEFLAKRGWYALSFDPPGSWESPGGIDLYSMTNYLQAIQELIEYFGNRPTLLMGHSRGGTLAMLAGVRNPEVVAFIAAMSRADGSPPIDSSAAYEINQRDAPEDKTRKVEFKLPQNYFVDSARYDARTGLQTSHKPKLFILGLEDKIITPKSVRALYKLAAGPKQLQTVPGGHDYRKDPTIIDQVNKMVGQFLDDNQL